MNSKIMLSLATVALFSATASADTTSYSAEERAAWINENVSNYGDAVSTANGAWTGSTTVAGGKVSVDTDQDNPVTFDPTAGCPTTDVISYRIDAVITPTLFASSSAPTNYAGTVPPAAIAAIEGSPAYWKGWDGEDDWVDLQGGDTPADGTPVNLTIEIGKDTKCFVRYSVNGTPLTTDGTVSNLYHSSATDLPSLTGVALSGYGFLGNFSASGVKKAMTVSIDTTDSALSTFLGTTLSDKNAAEVVAALNEVGGNKLPKWQSVVLGLPSTSEKPYTAPVQTSDGKLGFTIGNAFKQNFGTALEGKTVTFDVLACDTPDGTYSQLSGDGYTSGNSGSGYTAKVTPPESGVKYYKIKITIAD